MSDELYHYGVKGMKWGVRRTPEQLGHKTKTAIKKAASSAVTKVSEKRRQKKEAKQAEKESKKYKKRKVKDMSDEEIRERIKRLELEKSYVELMKATTPQQSKGSKFVEDVIRKSGDNIATQFTTYVLGTGTNAVFSSVFGEKVVNPKKGQKDK